MPPPPAAWSAPLKKSASMKVWTVQSNTGVGVQVSVAMRDMRALALVLSPFDWGTGIVLVTKLSRLPIGLKS